MIKDIISHWFEPLPGAQFFLGKDQLLFEALHEVRRPSLLDVRNLAIVPIAKTIDVVHRKSVVGRVFGNEFP